MIGVVISISIILFGCNQEPESLSIEIHELETPCEFTKAFGQIVDDGLKIKGDKTSDELSEGDRKNLEKLDQKLNDIEDFAKDKYTLKDLKACPDFYEIRRNSREVF